MNAWSIESIIIRNKELIGRTFDGKVNLDNMNLGDVIDLTRTINQLESHKKTYIKLSNEHPELINGFLRMMGEDIKCAGRNYNEYKGYDEKIIFSGLLGKYMREIKNASAGVLTKWILNQL